MVKRLFFLFSCLMALPAFALDIVNLRTEDYHNPVGIDKSSVHFSWQLESDLRGVLQTSYNIQIASDAAFGNVVWESGNVNSDQSVDVEAKGFSPAAETLYYWRVTVCDNKGGTAISTEKAYFKTGLAPSGSPQGGENRVLLEEHFDGSACMFQSGTLENRQFYVSGPGTYAWQQKVAKQVRFDVDFDFTLVQDNASICFSATSNETYMMWAVNTFDVAQPVVRRHVYNNGNFTYNAFSKSDHIIW